MDTTGEVMDTGINMVPTMIFKNFLNYLWQKQGQVKH